MYRYYKWKFANFSGQLRDEGTLSPWPGAEKVKTACLNRQLNWP
jgi:hypothetical protein